MLRCICTALHCVCRRLWAGRLCFVTNPRTQRPRWAIFNHLSADAGRVPALLRSGHLLTGVLGSCSYLLQVELRAVSLLLTIERSPFLCRTYSSSRSAPLLCRSQQQHVPRSRSADQMEDSTNAVEMGGAGEDSSSYEVIAEDYKAEGGEMDTADSPPTMPKLRRRAEGS